MRVQSLGHSCFLIVSNDQKTRILIDPFYDIKIHDPNPTHVVLTHGHEDHSLNVPQACSRGALLISTIELCDYMHKVKGVKNFHSMNIGGFVDFSGFRLKLVPATHSSSIGNTTFGAATGVVLELDGKILYHAGDTGVFSDMVIIGERHDIDLAFLPIGGNYTMDIEDALYAVKLLKPKYVIPMHYSTFEVMQVDPEFFVRKLPQPDPNIINSDPHLFVKKLSKLAKGIVLESGCDIEFP